MQRKPRIDKRRQIQPPQSYNVDYNKDKKRSRLNGETVANIIHTRDIKNSIDNVYDSFSQDDISLDTDRASMHITMVIHMLYFTY